MEGINYDADKDTLTYDIWSSQREALNNFIEEKDVDIVDFRGGYRSGKSVLGARSILYLAHKFENTQWGVVAYSIKEGKRSTYQTFFEQLPECDGTNPSESPIVKSYNATDKILILKNGSKIFLATSQNWDGLKGTNLNGCWLDETSYYNNLFDLITMILNRFDNAPVYGIISTTTTRGFNEYYHIFELRERMYSDKKIGWNIKTVTASVLNNPFLSEEVKERLKRTNEGNESEGLYGGFSVSSGRVYSDFQKETHIINSVSEYNIKGYLYGYDSGWNDKRVVLQIAVTTDDRYIVVDEYYHSEKTIEHCINWLKNKPNGIMYSESSPEHKFKFKRDLDGIQVKNASKSIDDGIESVKNRFKEDMNGNVGLLVKNNCRNLIQELQTYTESDVGGGNVRDHALDSLRYIIHTHDGSILSYVDGGNRKSGFSNRNRRESNVPFTPR